MTRPTSSSTIRRSLRVGGDAAVRIDRADVWLRAAARDGNRN